MRALCVAAMLCAVPGFLTFGPKSAQAADYEVGPGKTYSAIGDVPWESLAAGDNVLIYWRSTPYKEKWVICGEGTEAQPITVSGVPGIGGELPVIDGRDAVTRTELNFWNEPRGIVKIGGSSNPPDVATYIIVENLDVRSARPPHAFTDDSGSSQGYPKNAASIFIEKGDHITIRNCIIRDSGNGLFCSSHASDVLIEGCHIYDNGIEGEIYEHNSYTAAAGITFQYNHYGPLRTGCDGNNLKDRSAGQVVRYNWIEGGNRQLDLVDAEDSANLWQDPRYGETFVYGNILIEPDGAGNSQIVHYGGDGADTDIYRKGTLYFYNNTVVSTRSGNTTLFLLSTNDEHADCRNNIIYVTADGNKLAMLASTGVLDITHNWMKPGRVDSHSGLTGTINDDSTTVTGTSPGFVNEGAQDYGLADGSDCINAGTALHGNTLPANNVVKQYVVHQSIKNRLSDGSFDIGAFEFDSDVLPPDITLEQIVMSGTVSDAVSMPPFVTVDGSAVPVAAGAWTSGPIDLGSSPREITVQAEDANANTRTIVMTVSW